MAHNALELGIIGVGAIAAAIVEGMCATETAPGVLLSPRNAELAADLARRFPTVEVADDNQDVVARSSVVVLSVRPKDAAAILADLQFSDGQAIISVMAGIRLRELRKLVAPARDISRAIPLPAVAQRRGLTPIYPATPDVKVLFGRLGGTLDIADETAFDAMSAASGTVAAHLLYLATVATWLKARSVPDEDARRFVSSVFAALTQRFQGTAPDFDGLAREYSTRGGLNEEFQSRLAIAGLFDEVRDGLDRLLARLVSVEQ